MPKSIDNLAREVLYEAPGAFALFFAGAATYMSEGDPAVRQQLENTKHQVRHWAKLYNWGKKVMPIFIVGGATTAILAYLKSKEKIWLIGGATFLSIMPYTFLVMMKTNNQLQGILEKSGEKDLQENDKQQAIYSLKKWVNMHRGRVLLALGSAAVFFVAKQYSKGS